MKFIITEEEKKEIRNLYNGLLNEQQGFDVKIEGTQPYPNTNWDRVHGYFGSNKLKDDLEERVSDVLAKGNYRVENVTISTVKNGNTIKTKGSATLRQANPNEIPHKYFTTRGSIGSITASTSDPGRYTNRHDKQIEGLENRLKSYYNSKGVKVFGPYEIFITGTTYAYKQTFFAIEQGNSQNPINKTNGKNKIVVQGIDLDDLRNKMKLKTNLSINPNSFVVDVPNSKVEFALGNTQVKSLSFIFDNEGNFETRLPQIQAQNPTMRVALQGKTGGYEWAVVYFTGGSADETNDENVEF
jgi:hypothetical protein